MADAAPVQEDQVRLQFLVVRCQAGDEDAFGRLLAEFGPRTLRYLRGLVGDEAEDVHQEVWLSVYRSLASLADPRAFRTWLFSTTRRRAIDHLRRHRREDALLEEIAGFMSDRHAGGEDDAPDDLDDDAFDQAIAYLPAAQRDVLLLRFRDDLTYAEIALIVGCPVGTVKTRLHHARRKLREFTERRRQ